MNIETKKIIYALYYPIILLGILWLVKLVEITSNLDFSDFGNYPLSLDHLSGILLQPFIHENISHLWSNSIPLLFLVWSIFYFYGDISFKVFGLVWIGSGLFTWFIGRPSFHIGASGIVYGLAFFLFFSGLFRRMLPLMALSALVAFTYGGFVWNMLPVSEIWRPELSWEGHLSGAISGILLAIVYRKHSPQPVVVVEDSKTEEIADEYWLDIPDEEPTENTKE
ncbi:MAG: rhomboid family intramembrane serine protease [Bacteroidales bacterium]|nr:rhomboid family intramembrane serine protease [Bacteroidales bacterium]